MKECPREQGKAMAGDVEHLASSRTLHAAYAAMTTDRICQMSQGRFKKHIETVRTVGKRGRWARKRLCMWRSKAVNH